MTYLAFFVLGLIMFITGMQMMKLGLSNYSPHKIRNILLKFSSTPMKGMLTGTLLTALIQSSSAVTVIAIGLAGAGTVTFEQTIGIVLGTNIGTTMTAQLISLDITKLSPFFLASGFTLVLLFSKKRMFFLGLALFGFGLIFTGLDTMSAAVQPLKYCAFFQRLLVSTNESLPFAVLAGTISTAVLQSSSVIIGMVIVLAEKELVNLEAAVSIVLGSNIGTCITAVLAAAGSNLAARRVALAHVLLNVAGAVIFLPIITPFSFLISCTASSLPRQIANAHTIYNIICSLIVLPFSKQFSSFIKAICK